MLQDAVAVYLGPLLTDPSRIKREAVRRRKPFDEKSVSSMTFPTTRPRAGRSIGSSNEKTKVKREKEN